MNNQITQEDLFQLIGQKEVQIYALQVQLQQAQAQNQELSQKIKDLGEAKE